MPDDRRLRVGYVLKRFPRLSETFILNEILALERAGVDVEIFSLLKPPAEQRHGMLSELRAPITYLPGAGNLNGIKVLSGLDAREGSFSELIEERSCRFGQLYPAKTGEDVAALYLKAAALALLAQQRGVAHLHAHFGSDATTTALLAGRLSGLGYSFTAHARDVFHTYESPAADNAMRRKKIEEARFVVTVSDYNVRHLRNLCPVAADRIHRLYNGVDLGRLAPAPGTARPGLILAVGRMIEKKGFPDLVEACRLMAQGPDEFHCRIVGAGPMREQLARQAREADLADRIEFHAPVPQERLIEMMREASVVVLPCVVSKSGDRDGLPTVLLEAMALGKPVVSTRVSGAPEIVEHGETGLLSEPSDPPALAAMLLEVLRDPAGAARMGLRGRARAERLFDLDRNCAQLAAMFRDAIAEVPAELELVQ